MVLGERIKKIAAGLALAAALWGAPKKAEADTIELMAGHTGAKVDVELNIPLAKDGKLNLFHRDIVGLDYKNNVALTAVTQLAYDVYKGIAPVVGATVTLDGIAPAGGMQYFGTHGNLAMLGQATAGYNRGVELTGLAKLVYRPKLTEKLKLYTELEAICIANLDGLAYGAQKAMIGLDVKGVQLGAAAELKEIGPGAELGYNIGGFVQKEF